MMRIIFFWIWPGDFRERDDAGNTGISFIMMTLRILKGEKSITGSKKSRIYFFHIFLFHRFSQIFSFLFKIIQIVFVFPFSFLFLLPFFFIIDFHRSNFLFCCVVCCFGWCKMLLVFYFCFSIFILLRSWSFIHWVKNIFH